MDSTSIHLDDLARELHQAAKNRKPVPPLSERHQLSLELAYQVQERLIGERLAESEGPLVGWKVGLTSRAMQNLLKVDQPDWGVLLASMNLTGKSEWPFSTLIQPKVEPEIAFRLRSDLAGPGVTILDVLNATDRVFPALEIIDSRIQDWKIQIVDTVADNASSAYFLLAGEGVPLLGLDLAAVGVIFEKNKEILSTGTGSSVLGHPATPVAWLANILARFGRRLKRGQIILSGSLVAAADAKGGDFFRARFSSLGQVELKLTHT